MVIKSAGIIMVRLKNGLDRYGNTTKIPTFLCVKPGGPWKNMDWSIPKGSREKNDLSLKSTGIREFEEETGQIAPEDELIPIGSIRQRKGKNVFAWYFVDYCNEHICFRSNTYTIEHPKGSGKTKTYKEAIAHRFLTEEEAKEKLIDAQYLFIERVKNSLQERKII